MRPEPAQPESPDYIFSASELARTRQEHDEIKALADALDAVLLEIWACRRVGHISVVPVGAIAACNAALATARAHAKHLRGARPVPAIPTDKILSPQDLVPALEAGCEALRAAQVRQHIALSLGALPPPH